MSVKCSNMEMWPVVVKSTINHLPLKVEKFEIDHPGSLALWFIFKWPHLLLCNSVFMRIKGMDICEIFRSMSGTYYMPCSINCSPFLLDLCWKFIYKGFVFWCSHSPIRLQNMIKLEPHYKYWWHTQKTLPPRSPIAIVMHRKLTSALFSTCL